MGVERIPAPRWRLKESPSNKLTASSATWWLHHLHLHENHKSSLRAREGLRQYPGSPMHT